MRRPEVQRGRNPNDERGRFSVASRIDSGAPSPPMTTPHEANQDGQSSTEWPEQALVHNPALFREVNDHIRSVSPGRDLELVCECVDGDCVEAIRISAARYDEIRRVPTRFLVKPGHESPMTERVVDTSPDFEVIEKIPSPYARRGQALSKIGDDRA